MPESSDVALSGSERTPVTGAVLVGPSDPSQLVEVSIVLKQGRALNLDHLQGRVMSHDDFASAYGADPEHLSRVRDFAEANQLRAIDVPDAIARRTIKIQGTVANLEKAFRVTLNDYEIPSGRYRGRTGSIHIPANLDEVIQGVFGLDNRPQAQPHFRYRPTKGASDAVTADISYSPVQVAQLYSFPDTVTGAGQTIGIIELGGGFKPADLSKYFESQGIVEPKVTTIFVDSGTNSPGNPNSADGEVLLDIEVVGCVASGANIVVYFTPNTSQGFLDALSTAIHDTTNNPSVISISWGGPESTWTSQLMQTFDQVAQEGAALGVTITVAAGDNGSSDGVSGGGNHVDFPASSPHVLACGGTQLESLNGSVTGETVWNDGANGGATGGGYSTVFAQPAYQAAIQGKTGRGVPDVSGDAAPNTGYNILVDGEQEVIGGTSAVAPLWAGLVALLNQQLNTRLGFLNPTLYALTEPDNGFRDITQGNNGAYSAGPGWDPCTGLGSPVGTSLAKLLAAPPASAPSR